MSPTHHRWLRLGLRIALVLVVALLLSAGLRPNPGAELFYESDKLEHLFGFATLIICMRLALPRGAWWWQVIAAVALGGGIELVQNLVPARTGSIWDFLFDALGVGLGLLLLRLPVLQRLKGST